MRSKKFCFFLVLLLFSMLMCSVDALSDTTVSFRGGGVTIDLTFPEESNPNTTITHNVTITAHTDLSLQSFTLFIYAPVNATWQEVKNRTISWDFLENETLTSRIEFQLPQDTNGTLYCEMTAQTDQTADALSYKFYTTRVSELTFSEMQILYYEMLANYTSLQEDYDTLLNEYDSLWANYSSLFDNYTALVNEYDALSDQYDAQVANYQKLSGDYDKLLNDKNDLDERYRNLESAYGSKISEVSNWQAKYDELNATRYSLQANFTSLQADYGALNQTYTDLQTELTTLQEDYAVSEGAVNSSRIVMFIFIVTVAALIVFIVYIKRKKEEPYLVIRKETVSVKSDEDT